MTTKNRLSTAAVGTALLGLSRWANAIPTLHLGIAGGTYNLSTETIIASSSFSLYAYLIPKGDNTIGDTYTVSMAVSPQVNSPASLRTFTVNGDVIDVTSGMNYGIPPADATIETPPGGDSHDLPTHCVFPTYFIERSFSFSVADQSAKFNTQDHPSFGPQPGTGMYFKKFDIDVTNLDEGYAIHFDLYNTKPIKKIVCEDSPYSHKSRGRGEYDDEHKECTTTPSGELEITEKASFSHDAQSGPGDGGDGGNEVPEPASMLLVALGLCSLGWMRRKVGSVAKFEIPPRLNILQGITQTAKRRWMMDCNGSQFERDIIL